MIVSYRGKRTKDFAAGKRVNACSGIERAARLKLDRLEAASALVQMCSTYILSLHCFDPLFRLS